MDRQVRIPIIGRIPALDTVHVETAENPLELMVKCWVPYERFAAEIADDGLDSFGLRQGNYAVFRAARWPDRECQVCLVRFGDEMTIRLVEGITSSVVALRVSGDRVAPVELEPTDFSIVGILDGVVFAELAVITEPEAVATDWGC